jgi:hypothetical protein
MAKINLDIGHALSREDQRQNRRNPCFISQSSSSYSFSGNRAAKFSKKINRGFETLSAPSSLAATLRGLTFYLAVPISSIQG